MVARALDHLKLDAERILTAGFPELAAGTGPDPEAATAWRDAVTRTRVLLPMVQAQWYYSPPQKKDKAF